nr:hypothetical protein [Tanacetum cinerariifolium]
APGLERGWAGLPALCRRQLAPEHHWIRLTVRAVRPRDDAPWAGLFPHHLWRALSGLFGVFDLADLSLFPTARRSDHATAMGGVCASGAGVCDSGADRRGRAGRRDVQLLRAEPAMAAFVVVRALCAGAVGDVHADSVAVGAAQWR